MNPLFEKFRKKLTNPVSFRLFLLRGLPSAFFAGLRIHELDEYHATVTAAYGWFNTNPFRSLYFAIQAMAAEMSTGLLAWGHIYGRDTKVSMLVTGISANFSKKVTGRIFFSCNEGAAIANAVEQAVKTGEAVVLDCRSVGLDEKGEVAAEFMVKWSFKRK